MKKTVAVLGASNNPERYSNMAVKLLLEKGYDVIPVTPKEKEVEGLKAVTDLEALVGKSHIYTVSVYVNPKLSSTLEDSFLRLRPERVVFNPGSENEDLARALRENGVEVIEACTLVMLRAKTFED